MACGDGEKSQRSYCVQELSDGRQSRVEDSHCSQNSRLPERVACHVDCAGYTWTYSEWSQVQSHLDRSRNVPFANATKRRSLVFGDMWRWNSETRAVLRGQKRREDRRPQMRRVANGGSAEELQRVLLPQMGLWRVDTGLCTQLRKSISVVSF